MPRKSPKKCGHDPNLRIPVLRTWNSLELRQEGAHRVLGIKHWSHYRNLFLTATIAGLIVSLLLIPLAGGAIAAAWLVPFAIALSVPAIITVRRLDGRELLRIDTESRTLIIPNGTTLPSDQTIVYELHYNGCRFQASCLILLGDKNCYELFRVSETRPSASPMGYLCSICNIDYRIKPIYSWENLADEIQAIHNESRN